jgi:hypothetical protein
MYGAPSPKPSNSMAISWARRRHRPEGCREKMQDGPKTAGLFLSRSSKEPLARPASPSNFIPVSRPVPKW